MDEHSEIKKLDDGQLLNSDSNYLYIPLGLVASLFGTGVRTRIKRIQNRVFIIEKSDLINLHNRLDERVYHQNMKGSSDEPDPIFEGKIHFADNVIDTVNSISELASYPEGGKLIEKIEMQWTYFTKFSNRPSYEKQLVLLTIDAISEARLSPSSFSRTLKVSPIALYTYLLLSSIRGQMEIEINYTNYQWAIDIEKVLVDNLDHVFKELPSLKSFVSRNGFIISFLALAVQVFLMSSVFNAAQSRASQSILAALNSLPADDVARRTYLISLVIASKDLGYEFIQGTELNAIGEPSQYLFPSLDEFAVITGLTGLITFTLSLIFSRECVKPEDRSFILLTKSSYSEKDRYENRHSSSLLKFVFTVVCSIN